MKEICLGKTGLRVTRIGMGGIPIQRLSVEEADRLIVQAVELGINFFDSARIYTDSERKFGRVLPEVRQRVFIASKSFSRSRDQILSDVTTSLRELRTDVVDIYQCHNVASEKELDQVLAPQGAVAGLLQAQKSGKIRFIGISGHKPWILVSALQRFDFDTIQIPFNFMETAAAATLIPLAREKKCGLIAMKPIGGGNIRHVGFNFRYIFSAGIDVAIPGMDSVDQVRENLSVLKKLAPLSAAEIASLEEERRELGNDFCRRCEYCLPCPQGLPIAFLHVLKNYYFRYGLKDWVWERLQALDKTFQDCSACGECVRKCPYHLDNPAIFSAAWEKISRDRRPSATPAGRD